MHFLWLLGQVVIILGWCALLIAAVIAIWYGVSFVTLMIVSKLFRLRGRPPRD